MNNLGVTYRSLRRFDEAIDCHQQAIAISRETGNQHGVAEALTLGPVLSALIGWSLNESQWKSIISANNTRHGKLQGALEILGVPYTGSGVSASAVSMCKPLFKALLVGAGIPTLPWETIGQSCSGQEIAGVVEKLGLPLFVKPASGGESLGAGIAHNVGDVQAILGADETFARQDFIVEPYVDGPSFTVGVVPFEDEFRVLPILKVVSRNLFYDTQAKADPVFREYECPADLDESVAAAMVDNAVLIYRICQSSNMTSLMG